MQVSAQSTNDPASLNLHDVDNARNPDWAVFHSATQTLLPVAISTLYFRQNILEGKTSLALYTYGLIVGPSIGYFYGRDAKRAISGILLRGLGAGMLTVGVATFHDSFLSGTRAKLNFAYALAFGGTGLIVYSAIADLVRVKGAVVKRNAFYANKNNLSMMPIYTGKQGGYGLSLRLTL